MSEAVNPEASNDLRARLDAMVREQRLKKYTEVPDDFASYEEAFEEVASVILSKLDAAEAQVKALKVERGALQSQLSAEQQVHAETKRQLVDGLNELLKLSKGE